MTSFEAQITEKDCYWLQKTYLTSHEIIKNRGYSSIQSGKDLKHYPINASDISYPGLLVPCFSLRGDEIGFFYYSNLFSSSGSCTNIPEIKQLAIENGKEKEDPFVVSCEPSSMSDFFNTTKPIYLTNSPLISDALTTRGLCSMTVVNSASQVFADKDILEFLDHAFDPINLQNREIRIVGQWLEIFTPFPFKSSFLLSKSLLPKAAMISIVYSPKDLWLSDYVLGKFDVQRYPIPI